jgi:4-amino-4-deoxy-L-arabinose transferase-like glycosyltransferase
VAACGVLCALETALRLGAASPDTRFTLPPFSLGYFWGTPLGWTGLVDGISVNRDSVQFASLAGFFRDAAHLPVPPQDNVYVRFAGYSLLGSSLAPLLGDYGAFVLTNVVFWVAAAWATYVLAVRKTGSALVGALAAVLVSTAPAFAALAGQALPYVSTYALFALGLLLLDQARAFEAERSLGRLALVGFGAGVSLLFYDLYMLPAFVVVYGALRRARLGHILVLAAVMLVPRLLWTGYWQAMHLPSYSHNEQHPVEALLAWFDTARVGLGPLDRLKGYAFLTAHGLLNIGAVFLFWPLALAMWELWQRRRSPEAAWFVAVLVAGFAPALFMLSTWPHIPRWYAYGFPAVYVLAAAAAPRVAAALERGRVAAMAVAVLVVLLPAVVLANLDVVGYTRPMELLLFQPSSWSYLWSR